MNNSRRERLCHFLMKSYLKYKASLFFNEYHFNLKKKKKEDEMKQNLKCYLSLGHFYKNSPDVVKVGRGCL